MQKQRSVPNHSQKQVRSTPSTQKASDPPRRANLVGTIEIARLRPATILLLLIQVHIKLRLRLKPLKKRKTTKEIIKEVIQPLKSIISKWQKKTRIKPRI